MRIEIRQTLWPFYLHSHVNGSECPQFGPMVACQSISAHMSLLNPQIWGIYDQEPKNHFAPLPERQIPLGMKGSYCLTSFISDLLTQAYYCSNLRRPSLVFFVLPEVQSFNFDPSRTFDLMENSFWTNFKYDLSVKNLLFSRSFYDNIAKYSCSSIK